MRFLTVRFLPCTEQTAVSPVAPPPPPKLPPPEDHPPPPHPLPPHPLPPIIVIIIFIIFSGFIPPPHASPPPHAGFGEPHFRHSELRANWRSPQFSPVQSPGLA